MTMPSEPCEYTKFSNLQQLPCDWSKCSTADSRYWTFCCKACGKTTVVDVESASNPFSTGLGRLAIILGTLLVVGGVMITNEPQNPSVRPPQNNSITK